MYANCIYHMLFITDMCHLLSQSSLG